MLVIIVICHAHGGVLFRRWMSRLSFLFLLQRTSFVIISNICDIDTALVNLRIVSFVLVDKVGVDAC
jgi:hypothetical protein